MAENFFFNFQGRSKNTIEQEIQERSYKSTIAALHHRTESGKIMLGEKIARVFRSRIKNERIGRERHITAKEKSDETARELVDLIEKYASMTLSGELKQRLQRDGEEILETV